MYDPMPHAPRAYVQSEALGCNRSLGLDPTSNVQGGSLSREDITCGRSAMRDIEGCLNASVGTPWLCLTAEMEDYMQCAAMRRTQGAQSVVAAS